MGETYKQKLMDTFKRKYDYQDPALEGVILTVLDVVGEVMDELAERDRTRPVYDHSL